MSRVQVSPFNFFIFVFSTSFIILGLEVLISLSRCQLQFSKLFAKGAGGRTDTRGSTKESAREQGRRGGEREEDGRGGRRRKGRREGGGLGIDALKSRKVRCDMLSLSKKRGAY